MDWIDKSVEVLILTGVWLGVYLEWRTLAIKNRMAIKREVNGLMRHLGITVGLMLFLSVASQATMNKFAQWGIASAHPSEKSKSLVKFAEFGVTGEEGKLAYTVGIGGWVDRTGYKGGSGISIPANNSPTFHMKGGELQAEASDSYFMEMLFGVDPQCGPLYLTYKIGPSIISNTDALLGSNIQIAHEFGIGLRDIRGVRTGIVFKHFSNAGLVKPNLGRDFAGLRIEF